MSDSSPGEPGYDPVLPPPTLYDPADDDATPPGAEPEGAVALLLVGDADPAWAARTAVELSTAWARGGRRIVLADLHFESPVLHETVGDENIEGLVDVFDYGLSVTRGARPVAGRGFQLIPAGTYTPDAAEIYRHPRWARLVAGFGEEGASLVLFAPADGADLDALSRWVNEVVVLGDLADPAILAPLTAAGAVVRARLVQPRELPGRRAEGVLPGVAPLPPAPAADVRPPVVPYRPDVEEEMHLPPPPARTAPRSRPIYIALWLLLGIVVLALAGYVVGRLRPDLLPWPHLLAGRAGRDRAASPIAVAAPAAAPTPGGAALPYSVQVIAFQSLPAALERLAADRERVTGAPVFVSPEEIGGIVYYKILAGALADTTAARRLKESLVEDGVVNEQDAAGSMTLVQAAPLAFRLSEYPSREAADAAADSLLTRNIPAYPLAVPYSDGTQRWQLYAGAYRDSASSAPMRSLLTSAGLTPALVARSGAATARD